MKTFTAPRQFTALGNILTAHAKGLDEPFECSVWRNHNWEDMRLEGFTLPPEHRPRGIDGIVGWPRENTALYTVSGGDMGLGWIYVCYDGDGVPMHTYYIIINV